MVLRVDVQGGLKLSVLQSAECNCINTPALDDNHSWGNRLDHGLLTMVVVT